MLQSLVDISTSEEIKVYDKIIAEKKEFSFYSGVVSQFGLDSGLAASGGVNKTEFESQFKKSSLAWLLALARIEIGSTMAMYGNAKSPFGEIAPQSEYGLAEYWAILVDDVVAHMQALETDDEFRTVTKQGGKPNSRTLAYLRRLTLVTSMLRAVRDGGNEEYAAQAKEWQKSLSKPSMKIAMKILNATNNIEFVDQNVSKSESTSGGTRIVAGVRSCQRLAERLIGTKW